MKNSLIPRTIELRRSPKKSSKQDKSAMVPYTAYLRTGPDLTGPKDPKEPKGPKGPKEPKKINITRKPYKSQDNMRIIRSKEKVRKGRSQNHKTVFNRSKDINEIEKQMKVVEDKKALALVETETKVPVSVSVPVPSVPSAISRSSRSRKRPTKRHKDKDKVKARTKTTKATKGRRIRIRKKEAKAEDLKQIEQKINSIRNKKPRDIREALLKDGIQVSGKSNRLLQDIYFYSKVCNINIKHET